MNLGMSILGITVVPLAASVHGQAAGADPVTATVYVGRHFEVRDHDQPVKYVFDGDTRVARITGSLSANARLQRWRLQAGWNSVSLAVTATDLIGQLNQFAAGPARLVQALYQWQPATRDYAEVGAGQTVEAGAVLWLRARTNTVVAVTGTYGEPSAPSLAPGGGYLPSPGLERWSPTLPVGVTAWKYDSQSSAWRAGFTGDLAPAGEAPPAVAPGEAIYVHTAEAIELAPPEPTRRVLFYHPDHLGSSSAITDAAGQLAEETAFHPFGATRHEERLRPIEAHYGFTQKERDSESGFQYFGHRYLSSALGRWISTDPLLERGGGPNPYAYVNQSPLKHLDPDGAEITVTKGKDQKTGLPVYKFHMQAVLINVSSTKFSQQELAEYSARLQTRIKDTFTGGEKGKARWTASVDLRVIDHPSQIGDCDHVIRIMDKTRDDAAGATVAGTKVIDIAAHTLRRLRPDQVDRSNPMNRHYTWENYISPEGTGTHEVGHSAGLPHVHGTANLMQPGSERKQDNSDITRQQIEMMYKASSSGKLNQRDKELNDLTRRQ